MTDTSALPGYGSIIHTQSAPPSGLLLLHKPPGITSFEALGDIKRALGTGKVGHTGTLDKFACGLLVVLTGRALKLSTWFSHGDKQYEGTIRFGVETSTLDPEGDVTACAALPSRETVEHILPEFTGEILQAPPEYSAIHIDGKRASDLARCGQVPQMQQRPVHIYRLELRSWEPPFAKIFVHCSSGTYIRSLARDIALAAGSRAHVTALVRTRVAGFRLEDAVNSGCGGQGNGDAKELLRLQAIDTGVCMRLGIQWFELDAGDVQHIIHGKPLAPLLENRELCSGRDFCGPAPPCGEYAPGNSAAAVFAGGTFIAMLERSGSGWKYGYVYAR